MEFDTKPCIEMSADDSLLAVAPDPAQTQALSDIELMWIAGGTAVVNIG